MKAGSLFKKLLGELPYTAEMYWLLRNRENQAFSRFNLESMKKRLPQMLEELKPHCGSAPQGRSIFIFSSLHYWINHSFATGLALRGLGHAVTYGYLPYSDFSKPVDKFDLRRNDIYARNILCQAEPLVKVLPLLDIEPARTLPEELVRAVRQITTFDTRYILQREEVTGREPIFALRHELNLAAAGSAYAWFQKNRPDAAVIPNGMILEFGAVYETARFLGIPTVTYEFGEQDQRIWLGQNRWVIHHITDELWAARKDRLLSSEQKNWLESFLAGRQKLTVGQQFAHLWQKADRAGGARIRADFGLDDRPVVLLPTNVLGDSATLGLELFSRSMTEWMQKVLPYLAARPEIQVVIRIHPAETLTVGPSVMEIVRSVLPEPPPHIHLVEPTEKVNSYDLMEIADLALVYTTTAGLEMALHGIPVLVSGRAHYRRKGFTMDSDSWDEYFTNLDKALKSLPARLTPEQVELAWRYAHAFFAEYPRPFPWHVEKTWPSLGKRPLSEVLSPAGREKYASAFQELAGVPTKWEEHIPNVY